MTHTCFQDEAHIIRPWRHNSTGNITCQIISQNLSWYSIWKSFHLLFQFLSSSCWEDLEAELWHKTRWLLSYIALNASTGILPIVRILTQSKMVSQFPCLHPSHAYGLHMRSVARCKWGCFQGHDLKQALYFSSCWEYPYMQQTYTAKPGRKLHNKLSPACYNCQWNTLDLNLYQWHYPTNPSTLLCFHISYKLQCA